MSTKAFLGINSKRHTYLAFAAVFVIIDFIGLLSIDVFHLYVKPFGWPPLANVCVKRSSHDAHAAEVFFKLVFLTTSRVCQFFFPPIVQLYCTLSKMKARPQ